MDLNRRREVAIWRMNILGPLISARLDHGERRTLFEEAAARSYTAPNGKQTRLSWRTIENWYYAYKAEGLSGLEPRPRADRGAQRSISDDVAEHILALRRENPRRSIRMLIKTMVRAKKVTASSLTRSSVARLLRAQGLSQRPRELPERERRAFTVEHPNDLWMGDGMEGPPVIGHDGKLHKKPRMLSQIDTASRYSIYSEFFVTEDSAYQEIGLRRAVTSHGIPREYYVDGGAAYIAGSLKTICAELGIRLLHAGPGDAAAKGVIERWHKTWRQEVGSELPDGPLHIDQLNEYHVCRTTLNAGLEGSLSHATHGV